MLKKSLITLAWAEMKCDSQGTISAVFLKEITKIKTVETSKHNQGNQVLRSN